MLKLEVVIMGHAVISCEEGMIVGLEERVECMGCGSREDVWAGERLSTERGEVGGDESDPVGEGGEVSEGGKVMMGGRAVEEVGDICACRSRRSMVGVRPKIVRWVRQRVQQAAGEETVGGTLTPRVVRKVHRGCWQRRGVVVARDREGLRGRGRGWMVPAGARRGDGERSAFPR